MYIYIHYMYTCLWCHKYLCCILMIEVYEYTLHHCFYSLRAARSIILLLHHLQVRKMGGVSCNTWVEFHVRHVLLVWWQRHFLLWAYLCVLFTLTRLWLPVLANVTVSFVNYFLCIGASTVLWETLIFFYSSLVNAFGWKITWIVLKWRKVRRFFLQ